jgi:hypothetical protein
VHEALPLADGSYRLNPKPLAQLGPGRVLGSKLDADGNLVMCDVLKVRATSASAAVVVVATGRVTARNSWVKCRATAAARTMQLDMPSSIGVAVCELLLPQHSPWFAWLQRDQPCSGKLQPLGSVSFCLVACLGILLTSMCCVASGSLHLQPTNIQTANFTILFLHCCGLQCAGLAASQHQQWRNAAAGITHQQQLT